MFRQLLRQIDRTVLAARTAETDHQVLKTSVLIILHAVIHQRHYMGQIVMDALLRIEIFGNRRVLAGERLKPLFAPGIRQAAGVENEAAAISGLVLGRVAAKRKTE